MTTYATLEYQNMHYYVTFTPMPLVQGWSTNSGMVAVGVTYGDPHMVNHPLPFLIETFVSFAQVGRRRAHARGLAADAGEPFSGLSATRYLDTALNVDGAAGDGEGGFLDRLRQRRVGVAGARNILG